MATVPSSILEGRWKNVSLSQAAALCSLTCCWLCVVWDFCLLGFCLVVALCLKTSWFTKQNLGDKLQFNSCVSLQLFTFQSLSAVHIVRVLHSLFCRFHYNIFLIIFLITSHTVFFFPFLSPNIIQNFIEFLLTPFVRRAGIISLQVVKLYK